MNRNIFCPYCLGIEAINLVDDGHGRHLSCSACKARIPPEYANNANLPRDVISAVGFRGHGKTVYFASLLHGLDGLADIWPGFYTHAVEEKSLDNVRQNNKLLKAGVLPDATPMNFPTPTIMKFVNMPNFGNRFFLFYDTSGEAYMRQSALIKHASFVKRSRTVIFILSLDDLEHEDQKMHELLSTYVQGIVELKGNTKNQHLIVVLSKADRLGRRLERYQDIWQYLEEGRLEKLGGRMISGYLKDMSKISLSIRRFIKDELKEAQFLNFADDRFKSVDFSIVSALGAEPAGNKLREYLIPKRIMDPLLWVTYKSLGLFRRLTV